MSRYVVTRLAEMVPVLFLVSLGTFALIHLVPGDPVTLKLGLQATPERIAQLRSELGLDQPLPEQYWEFLRNALTLDFGVSIQSQESVGDILARRAGPSLLLVAYSLLVSLVIAIPLAIVAAVRRRTWVDQAIRVGSTFTFVMPTFWLALLLVLLFSLELGWLPTSGYGDTFAEHVEGLTLPALTMGLALAPVVLRMLRSSITETMGADYVEAARASGLSPARVLGKHVLRNSATSTVTLLGLVASTLLSTTVIVETIFSIPGLGSLMVTATENRDFPIVQAVVLLSATAVLLISLVTDLCYALLDPRVRL